MYRYALEYLAKWRDKKNRKPLVIRGARQVGKSYLVKAFASEHFDNFIEVNFDDDASVAAYFDHQDPHETVRLLELHYDASITPGKTLLFIDEIQIAPMVFSRLRYFYEKMPELHVISAGSLLDFTLEQHEFSMPVGRIEYLHLGPMSFTEFLLATGSDRLCRFIHDFQAGDLIPAPLHNKLNDWVKRYLVVGGMPESVKLFAEDDSFRECDFAKETILATYKDDFGKYGVRINRQHLLAVFEAFSKIIGIKLKYVNISREFRSRDLSIALHQLALARVCYPIYHSSCNGVPLGAEINHKVCKLLLLDVGLLTSACGLSMKDITRAEDLIMINAGQICEQFIGQHLLYRQEFYKQPELHYWRREKATSNAEVDFVISFGQKIIPVEVKAGKTGTMRSLHQFTIEKDIDFSVKVCSEPPSMIKAEGRMPNGEHYNTRILSLPFYLIEKLSDSDFIQNAIES